ncbi:MAG: hypothetical protein GC131_05665 [Alphaproteobacteria bacterium]|nr:hypothetical protein [Alphaproteobacteria bacterium]
MNRTFVLLALSAALLTPAASVPVAVADDGIGDINPKSRCLRYREPVVKIVPIHSSVRIDDRTRLAELGSLASNGSSKAIRFTDHDPNDQVGQGRGHIPVGLATSELITDIRYDISVVDNMRGYACGQITSLRLDVGFRDNTIYVAREIPRRSCSYKEVLEHEHKHVTTDERFLSEAMPRIKKYMKAALAEIGHVQAASRADMEEMFNQKMNLYMKELINNMSRERQILQGNVDTPEEYRRITYSCDGQLIEILRMRYGANWLEEINKKK